MGEDVQIPVEEDFASRYADFYRKKQSEFKVILQNFDDDAKNIFAKYFLLLTNRGKIHQGKSSTKRRSKPILLKIIFGNTSKLGVLMENFLANDLLLFQNILLSIAKVVAQIATKIKR